ncbi:MAG: hypothetical protein LBD45_00940 [Bacteroidales bacterium]|jgi:hypothetical protein|nr:hypothetical protein [Bacteroidales bacterium]
MKTNKIFTTVFILVLFFSCGNKPKQGQETEIALANEKFAELGIDKLQIKDLPLIDSTSFDNYGFANKLNQTQIQALKLNGRFNDVSDFYLNYRINLSENVISLVISYQKGEYELFTVLINYDDDYNIIDTLDIAYDEIAESLSRIISTVQTDKILVERFNYMEDESVSEISVYNIDTLGVFQMK